MTANTDQKKFMQEAINLSLDTMRAGKGGPFGAVIVKDGEVIARGSNQVTSSNDPTAHAEVVAIREACKILGTFQLNDCEMYTSCEPCPMCFGAIYWARLQKVYYGNTRDDAAKIGFDDELIYKEIAKHHPERILPMQQIMHAEALEAFKEWLIKTDRVDY
jgi:guanine deaminase